MIPLSLLKSMKRILAIFTALLVAQIVRAANAQKPNIIVILADDLGWGDPGCQPKGEAWGEEARIATPNIDALAAGGARCTDGYATCMVCSPSRAALLAGRYQQRLGFYGFPEANAGIPKDVRLLPEALRAAGYATGMIGKWHVGFPSGQQPLDRGFDQFFGMIGGQHDYFDARLGQPIDTVSNAADAPIMDGKKPLGKITYLTDEFTDRALNFMQTAAQGKKPFFLYLPYSAPHPPMQALWKDLEPFAKKRANSRFNERDIARAMIVNLDENVGRLLRWLRESGLEKDTLVFFTSDNGGADDGPGHVTQHNGGLRGRKGYFYEGGIRIPYLVSWPGRIPPATVYHQPVSHLDIYATALAVAGVTDAASLDGVNLMPFLRGEREDAPHAKLFWGMENTATRWAVREGGWKLVNEDTRPTISQRVGKATYATQLYHLADDPFEQHDLAKEQPGRVAALQRAMNEFQATMKPSLFTAEVAAARTAALAERKKNPALREHPRVDGSPGHWIGAGAKERMAGEANGSEKP